MKLSVIIPVYNEERHLESFIHHFYQATQNLEKEIIIVNDCSTDLSYEILKKLQKLYSFQLFNFSSNQGKGATIIHALEFVSGDFTLIQDADFEYDPNEIEKLIKALKYSKADAIYGNRFKDYQLAFKNIPHFFANIYLTKLSNCFTHFQISDMETCYKLIRTKYFKQMDLSSKRFGIEVEITAKLSQLNAHLIEVPISYSPRSKLQGKKINWKDGLAAIFHILKFNLFTKIKLTNQSVELDESHT